jgi:hypothetical protein
VSVKNDPVSTQQTSTQASLANDGPAQASAITPFDVTIVGLPDRLTAGETIDVEAVVNGGDGTATVTMSVNKVAMAVISGPPYVMTFTIPFGVSELSFGAAAASGGSQASAAPPVLVAVDRDLGTSVSGRLVDEDGKPIAGATLGVMSDGLRAEFFDATDPLDVLPNVDGLTPNRVSRVTAINTQNPAGVFGSDPLGTGLAPDYAARFTGWLVIPADGLYTLFLGADAGARLKVGGTIVIDLPNSTGGFQESSGTVTLSAGAVPIEITYFANATNAQLQLSWAAAGGPRRVVRPELLVPGSAPLISVTDGDGRFTVHGVPTALRHLRLRVTPNGADGVDVPIGILSPMLATDLGDIVINKR